MEILILGIILVSIMAYLSTKIKAASQAAYEEEKIETSHFSLIKPKDFLHPYKENSEYAFEAYSREYGENKASKIPQASIFVSIYKTAEDLSTQQSETEETKNGITFKILSKALRKDNKVFELKAIVLKEYYQDYADKIKQVFESFRVK
jgi:hypothetical protein